MKKTTVDLIEESEVVSLYSISFAMDRTTEFERFMEKFEQQASYNTDYQKVLYAVSMILRKGALERFFRKLLGYVMDLQKFEALLKKDIDEGIVSVEERHLVGVEDKTYEI